jgi:CheY-like chemotaxis protein
LIIDDEQAMRRGIVRILKKAGHETHEAADGRAGMRLFRRVRPDLVITDLIMPEAEGIETIREIHREAPEVPIMAISGREKVYLRAAKAVGAQVSLEKPFRQDALLALVDRLLEAS